MDVLPKHKLVIGGHYVGCGCCFALLCFGFCFAFRCFAFAAEQSQATLHVTPCCFAFALLALEAKQSKAKQRYM